MLERTFEVKQWQLQTYAKEGAVKLEKLLPARSVASLVTNYSELDETFRRYLRTGASASRRRAGTDPTGRQYLFLGDNAVVANSGALAIYSFLARDFPAFRMLAQDNHLAAAIASIVGSTSVAFWCDEIFVKEASAENNGTPWHHDIAAWPFKGRQLPTLWIALTDVSADASPLMTITGSHGRSSTMFPPPRESDGALELGYEVAPNFDALLKQSTVTARTWTLRAGDAVLFHPYTIHGAPPNRSAAPRAALSMRWIGDDVRLRPDSYSVIDPLLCHNGRWLDTAAAKRALAVALAGCESEPLSGSI